MPVWPLTRENTLLLNTLRAVRTVAWSRYERGRLLQVGAQVSPDSTWLEPLTTIPKVVDPPAATDPS
jgi:hypothetical protein